MTDASADPDPATDAVGVLDRIIRPRSIAVIGASPQRQTLGNVALDNMATHGYPGSVVAVHAEATSIAGRPIVRSIEELPDGIDVVLASVAAAGVADVIRRLDRRGVPTAIVNTAGFSPDQEAELRDLVRSSRIVMHGPNCMGLINMSDATPIYTGGITPRLKAGPVGLVAQSGSAAISVINSSDVGFSKIVTIGSEYRLTAADYLGWLAADDATRVVGLVLEAIPDADRFADAVDLIHAAGKALVVLKVGRSVTGSRATQAHTGALVGSHDAFVAFAERYGLPLVDDYEQLIASLELFAGSRRQPTGRRVAIMGISGGETAMACDLCDEVGLPLATFSDETARRVRAALPGVAGENPLDIGQSIGREPGAALAGMTAIMADDEVGAGIVLQDMQHSLPESSHRNYTVHLEAVAALSGATGKPLVLVAPTSEVMSARLLTCLSDTDVPTLRGLRAGLVATRTLLRWSERRSSPRRLKDRGPREEHDDMRRRILGLPAGPVPAAITTELLARYGIPVVGSAIAATAEEALDRADAVGFPMVVKVISQDVPHRSEIGAVQLGITNEASLRNAIAAIERNVRLHRPNAAIEGFELQEELVGWVEAMAGYQAAPPFGALTVFGSGGVLVEIESDRACTLSPADPAGVDAKVATTRLGKRLAGYRKLMPPTPTAPFSTLVSNLSTLAADFCDILPECDLNPVLIRPGTGEVRVVDALLIAGSPVRWT